MTLEERTRQSYRDQFGIGASTGHVSYKERAITLMMTFARAELLKAAEIADSCHCGRCECTFDNKEAIVRLAE